MFDSLNLLRTADLLARHAAGRQAVLARNVANADTPGFRARDTAAFADGLDRGGTLEMRRTRPQHLAGGKGVRWQTVDAPDGESPDGNTVSLEEQMLKAAETRQSHDLALTVYSAAMSILRSSIGSRR